MKNKIQHACDITGKTEWALISCLANFVLPAFRRVLSTRTNHAIHPMGRGFAVLGLSICLAGTAAAQVTYVGFASASGTGSATLTIPNVNPSGTNKLLLVSVGVGSTSPTYTSGQDPTPPTVVSVTYNGVPMTLVQATLGSETRTNLYSLTNPVNGPFNVVITLSGNVIPGTTPQYPIRVNGTAAWFTGVHPVTPLGTPSFVQSGVAGNPLNLTLASTTSDDLIYSTTSVDEGTPPQIITVAGGQTTITNQSGNSAISSATSYESGTGSAVTSTYTFAEGQDHSGIIVAVKALICPVPNCGTVTLVKNP